MLSSRRASLMLGGILLIFSVTTALATAWIVHQTYTPILFFDQWAVVNQLMQSDGHLSLAQLWQLHNEHRIPWGKLAGEIDLKAFGGRNISLLVEIYTIQAMEALCFIWIFRRYRGLNPAEVMTAAGLFVFAMFFPIQIENFYWGFQVAFVTLPFAAGVSIGALVVHSDLAAARERGPWYSWPLGISLGGAVFAETSLASGILIWPLLLLVSFVLRMPARTKYLIAATGAVASGVFLWGFHSPGNTAQPLDSLRHPIAVGKFVQALLAWSWDSSRPTGSLWPSLAQLCATVAAMAVVGVFLQMLWSRSSPDKLQLFLVTNAVFLLGTALVIALGRMNFGIEQAIASRYQTIALAFWASFGALLLVWRTARTGDPVGLIEVQIAVLFLLLASVPRFGAYLEVAKAHQRSLAESYATVLEDPSNSGARGNFSPYPNFAEAHTYLESHHWGVVDRDLVPEGVLMTIDSSSRAQWKVDGFQTLPPEECVGHIDWVRLVPDHPNSVLAGGWAFAEKSSERPRRILLVLDDGSVAGSGQVSIRRPDVRQQVARVTEPNTGWRAEASLPPGRTLRAFIVADQSAACAVTNEFVRR